MNSERVFNQHFCDEHGNPEGGVSSARGITISWQRGPLGRIGSEERQEPNGAFAEDVLVAAMSRLEFYQSGRFACDENNRAIIHLQCALDALNERTKRRVDAQTEGTHEGH